MDAYLFSAEPERLWSWDVGYGIMLRTFRYRWRSPERNHKKPDSDRSLLIGEVENQPQDRDAGSNPACVVTKYMLPFNKRTAIKLTAPRRKGFPYLVIFSSSLSLGSTDRLLSYISCTSPAACMLLRM